MNIIEINANELNKIKGLSLFHPKKKTDYCYDRFNCIFWQAENKRMIATDGYRMGILKNVNIAALPDHNCCFVLDGNYLKEVNTSFSGDFDRVICKEHDNDIEIDYDLAGKGKASSYYKDVKLFSFIEYTTKRNFNPELIKDISKYFEFKRLAWNDDLLQVKIYNDEIDFILMSRNKKENV